MKNVHNNTKEIGWINVLKAICMIFVYFGHSELFYGEYIEPADWFRLTFNTNAFFFVSGYLLFWKQLSSPRIDAGPKQFIRENMKKTQGIQRLLFIS